MPKLNDVDQLGTYSSFSEAKDAVKKGMEASSKVKEVYSLDVDSNTRMVGVSVLDKSGSESTILGVADRGSGSSNPPPASLCLSRCFSSSVLLSLSLPPSP
eukprot:3369275-Rhodomonas_salina.1